MVQYADKVFYSLEDTGYIFTTANGKRISGKSVYELHRKFLDKAGIPYIGDGNGPRIHDWRYPNQNKISTFCEKPMKYQSFFYKRFGFYLL